MKTLRRYQTAMRLLSVIAIVFFVIACNGSSSDDKAKDPPNKTEDPKDDKKDPKDDEKDSKDDEKDSKDDEKDSKDDEKPDGTDQTKKINVNINSINTDECPKVKVYVSFTDEENNVIEDDESLSAKVIEDGVEQTNDLSMRWLTDQTNAISVVLAMDYSVSMVQGGTRERDMINAAKKFVDLMKPEDKAAIVKFFYTPEIMSDLTSEKDALNKAIDAQPTSQMYTNIYDTVYLAADLLANETGPVALILITDGGHALGQVEGYLTPEEYAQQDGLTIAGHTLSEAVAYANSNRMVVHTIGFKNPEKHGEIKEIAADTGGAYYPAENGSALDTIYKSLFTSLEGNQHEIVFTSDTNDTEEHTISVEAMYGEIEAASENFNSTLCSSP